MQSIASVSRGLARVAFRSGSPQRIQYSAGLTVGGLVTLLGLAIVTRVQVFQGGLMDVCLYLFTGFAGLYLGTALLSRRAPAVRLRTALQATVLLLTAAHAAILISAPLAGLGLERLPWLVAALGAVMVVVGTSNCVQFALGRPRGAAAALTVAFAFAVVAFHAVMQHFLAIALA